MNKPAVTETEACPIGTECSQGNNILHIGLEISVMRKELRQRDDKLFEVLESVADQGARISAVVEETHSLKKDVENLFERQRKVEAVIGPDGSTIDLKVGTAVDAKLEKIIKFITLVTSWPAVAVASALAVMTLVGTLFDLWYHFDGVRELYGAWKIIHK